jgi:hypothetical protein
MIPPRARQRSAQLACQSGTISYADAIRDSGRASLSIARADSSGVCTRRLPRTLPPKQKPTWLSTMRYSTTSVYSSTSPPAKPDCSSFSRPTTPTESETRSPTALIIRLKTPKGNALALESFMRQKSSNSHFASVFLSSTRYNECTAGSESIPACKEVVG